MPSNARGVIEVVASGHQADEGEHGRCQRASSDPTQPEAPLPDGADEIPWLAGSGHSLWLNPASLPCKISDEPIQQGSTQSGLGPAHSWLDSQSGLRRKGIL